MPQNKRFTKNELDFIKKNAKILSVDDMAKELHRTPKGVRAKIERLGIRLSELDRNQPFDWTKERVEFVKKNYKDLSDAKIADVLGTVESVVLRKRLSLDLGKQSIGPYMHGGYWCFQRDKKNVWVHKLEAEKKIGRKLHDHEVVHHVNGDKGNNEHINLYVCDKRGHGLAHDSLEKAAFELYKLGYIGFDESAGDYFVKHDKLPIRTEG